MSTGQHISYDELADLVGGKFQLTVLMQKRLRELNRGAKPCVKIESDNPMDIVIAEIREGAIQLQEGEDLIESLRQASGSKEEQE